MAFKHVKYGLSIKMDKVDLPKCYGIVRRKNKPPYIRNYKRTIKGGMDMYEYLQWKFKEAYRNLDSGFKSLFTRVK